MKKIAGVVVFLLFLTCQVASAETFKTGVVDLMRALNESDSGKKAKADLENLIRSKQGQLDSKGKEIEKLKGELEKQSSVLSADARKHREEELERLLRDYQRLVTDSQGEVKKREGEMTAEIIKELRGVVEKLGKEGDYTLILENADGLVLFAKKDMDLTDTVIKKYNEFKAKK